MGTRKKDIGRAVKATADPSQLELFDTDSVTAATGIRVFDVGQGDCIGLTDQEGQVFCYIDYGGLADHPDTDHPENTAQRLTVSYRDGLASIILTHWDKDHYWSAVKKNPQAQACEWLVPRQMASPSAARFAKDLENAKCWPEDRGKSSARIGVGEDCDIEIRKCGAFSRKKLNEDRNKTGLAVTLLHWENERVERFMLLPGDCPFHLIPGRPEVPVSGLVAYHHGARTHWTKATKQAIANFDDDHRMVYSYGANDYGHPYVKNYRPEWHAVATATADLRDQGQPSVDIRWAR
jgi:hypothetical protein